MSRISLKETYDNRSVIAQIAKVTDTAEDAAETVEQKATEINDALTDVNAAVQAAEGAVTTANAASAAAQQSAQTVAGYNTRLTTAEGEIDTLQNDLNSVTLRVQTAEGNIVTIQGRVTALETADGQNVKLTGTHAIGNYALLLTDNQNYDGIKRAIKTIVKKASIEGSTLPANYWIDNHLIEVQGNTDNTPIISIGSERGNTGWSTRVNLNLYGSTDPDTQRQNMGRIIFIFDEINKQIRMQVGRYDAATGNMSYSTAQTLLSW